MILDKRVDIFRLLPDPNDADYRYYQPFRRNVFFHIQPATPEYVASVGGVFGRIYRGFTSISGLHIGDKIAVSGTASYSGMEYVIRGISDWNFGPLPHFELTLEEGGI